MTEPNGMLGRISAIAGIIRDVGFPVVMVAIFVGWATGWIPLRPFDNVTKTIEGQAQVLADQATKLTQHDQRVAEAQERRLAIDKSMAESIQRFTLLAERMERRERLTYCVNTFRDPALRRDCLQ